MHSLYIRSELHSLLATRSLTVLPVLSFLVKHGHAYVLGARLILVSNHRAALDRLHEGGFLLQ